MTTRYTDHGKATAARINKLYESLVEQGYTPANAQDKIMWDILKDVPAEFIGEVLGVSHCDHDQMRKYGYVV